MINSPNFFPAKILHYTVGMYTKFGACSSCLFLDFGKQIQITQVIWVFNDILYIYVFPGILLHN